MINMRWLWAAVIGMGILIVIGTSVMVTALILGASAVTETGAPARLTITLPEGVVRSGDAFAGSDGLFLPVVAEGRPALALIDPARGAVRSILILPPR